MAIYQVNYQKCKFSIYIKHLITQLTAMFSHILTEKDYQASDPFVRDIIDEQIRKELIRHFTQASRQCDTNTVKGKTSYEQTIVKLQALQASQFKYLWLEDVAVDFNYEQDDKKTDEKEREKVLPKKFRILGYRFDPKTKLNLPIFKLSDVYLTTNPRVRRLINKVFEVNIYGKHEERKTEAGTTESKSALNAEQLERFFAKFQQPIDQKKEEKNQIIEAKPQNEQQLNNYLQQKGLLKSDYFLYYKYQQPSKVNYQVVNHPLKSQNFLKKLHADVRAKERQYYTIEDVESDEETLAEEEPEVTNKEVVSSKSGKKKKKEYFGQFKRLGKPLKPKYKIRMEDQLQGKFKQSQEMAKNIIDYYSYIDRDIANQQYKKSLEQNDRLEINLSNPYFFQPKLHTILSQQKQMMILQSQYKAKLAQAEANGEKSLFSGNHFNKLTVIGGSELSEGAGQNEEQNVTIEAKINGQIKNIAKQPIKHSQVANRYELVRFSLQQDAFNHFHRYCFPFHDHFGGSAGVKIEVHRHKNRRIKPNGLVLNAEMKQSNQKFTKVEDLSCTKGEFIIVQYIEENPILMSSIGMCERMFVQVNYLQILAKMREALLQQKSIQEMQEYRDLSKGQMPLSYIYHAQLWRKMIKETFGENSKQFYWQPKLNTGKVIGVPEGPGVIVMESNLGTVPIVKKKQNFRDYLLVREGKRWVLRKIQNIYVSGQVEPNKKVFGPASKQYFEFKVAYEKAFILSCLRQHQTVNFDELKLLLKGQSQNSLKKLLKECNATSKDSKNYKITKQTLSNTERPLLPEDICVYQRMQKSICQLKQFGISHILSSDIIKTVLDQFNKKNHKSSQKIVIAKIIKERLLLTSWYLTDSFLKYKQKVSKIQINGFADPTNGRGGYSFIIKPQKAKPEQQDMQQKMQKQKTAVATDLRKLKSENSKQTLRAMGHNEDQIEEKSRRDLINLLKSKEGTEFSRKHKDSKLKREENEKKQLSINFNKLLAWLRDETEQPAFDYSISKRNTLVEIIHHQQEYIQKIRKRYGSQELTEIREQNIEDESDGQN